MGAMQMISGQLRQAQELQAHRVVPQVVPQGNLEKIEKQIDALKKLEKNLTDDGDDARAERFKKKRRTLEDELFLSL